MAAAAAVLAQPVAVSAPPPVLRIEPEPAAAPAPALIAPPPVESPFSDPLFALAERIRAAQQTAPVDDEPAAGLQNLAVAVSEPAPPPAPQTAISPEAPQVQVTPPPAPVATAPVEAVPEAPKPVALLAPPVPEPVPAPVATPVATAVALAEPPVAIEPLPAVPSPEPPAAPEPAPPAALANPLPPALPKPAAPAPHNEQAGVKHPLLYLPPSLDQGPPESVREKPPSGSWLRLAPLQSISNAASRSMHPAAPSAKVKTPDSGPKITLPGPMLPPDLQHRKDLRVASMIAAQHKRRGTPGWLVSLMVMAALLATGVFAVVYLLPSPHTTAIAKSPAPETAPVPETVPTHPLADYVEVTGFRFIMDLNKKSEVHYLVVNHSTTDLSDMTVFVTVRTANAKPGQPPVCRFSFKAAGLGPLESKEMVSSIERLPRPVTLPDWHDLKADVQISQ